MNDQRRSSIAAISFLVTLVLVLSACSVEFDISDELWGYEDDPRSYDDGRDDGNEVDPDNASDPDEAPDPGPEPEPRGNHLASGIEITSIDAFQTIQISLVKKGAAVASDVALIAGRDTLIRVFITPEQGWSTREITAQMRLNDSILGTSELLESTLRVSGPSSIYDRTTVFEFRVPGDLMTPDASTLFRLVDGGGHHVAEGLSSPAQWPRDGSSISLHANNSTGVLRVVLVPVRFDSDGSGRLPDTSPAQLAIYEETLRALFPIYELELVVREPVSWAGSMIWGNLTQAMRELKASDGEQEAYYYGLIQPAATFDQYCSGGCTVGQAFLVSSAEATSYRAGAGLGYGGEGAAWTLAHEIGHMHGQGHAHCGVSAGAQDSSYPYSGGVVGVWGWDFRSDSLYAPNEMNDFMGYCGDQWTSDYTYLALMNRMQDVNHSQHAMWLSSPPPISTWHHIDWSPTRPPTWSRITEERDPSTGEWALASFVDGEGRVMEQVEIPYVQFSHDGERSVVVPEAPERARVVRIDAPSKSFELELP